MVGADLHEGFDGFSLQRIGNADGCGFGDGGMRDQRALDFGGADAVSGNVEDVVGAAEDGDVSVFVFHGNVAGDVAAGEKFPVALISRGVAPYGAQHTRERALEHETSTNSGRGGLAVFIENVGFGAGDSDSHFAGTHRHGRRSSERGSA